MSRAKPHSISIPKDLLEAGKAKAAREGRSFSNWACHALAQNINPELPLHAYKPSRKRNS